MSEEENLIFILPFIFLIFKLLLNCIKNNNEETLTDENEETLTDENEETLTDENEETLTDENEETLTDKNEETLTDESEETLIDDTNESEETLTDESEETLTDESEETLTDESEETLTDKSEKDDNEESEEDSDEELTDYTKSKIIKLKINNKKVDVKLKYKSILKYIYENEINDGFKIIKNTLFNDIKTFKKEDKEYYYLENIGISVKFKNSNDSFNEIINQCEINNIKLYMKIELFDSEIKKIKI